MEKVLKAIGNFFKKIWGWIKNTAWVQPLLIVVLIFGIIFSINPIIKGIKGLVNNGEKVGAYYSKHDTKFSNLKEGKNYLGEDKGECLVVYVDLKDETKSSTAKNLEIYLKNFANLDSSRKIYVVNIGSDNFLGDDNGRENVEKFYDEYADLYNYSLPVDSFTYDIHYSAWDQTSGENEYLNGETGSIYLNSPTYVKYNNGVATDIRFDISSYKDSNGSKISELTVLNDLWNGTNK